MKRRTFLKTIMTAAVAVAAGGFILGPKKKVYPIPMDLRRQLEYQTIGRKLLMVEELPQGAYARYEKDMRSKND